MPFGPPTFNLTCNIWHRPNVPPAAPDVVSPVNLSQTKNRASPFALTTGTMNAALTPELLLPKLTDIRGRNGAGNFDLVECPAGSGRFYCVQCVEDVAKGFTNEYRLASVRQLTTETLLVCGIAAWNPFVWPVPTP